jgi:hypothetical protein
VIAAVAGAAIGYALGYFMAFQIIADNHSALTQSGLVGAALHAGAAIGAFVGYRLANAGLNN